MFADEDPCQVLLLPLSSPEQDHSHEDQYDDNRPGEDANGLATRLHQNSTLVEQEETMCAEIQTKCAQLEADIEKACQEEDYDRAGMIFIMELWYIM